jgi:hypothetical protein
MDPAQNVSQLTLIKTFYSNYNCTVHAQINGQSFAFEIKVNDTTSVDSFINEAITLL